MGHALIYLHVRFAPFASPSASSAVPCRIADDLQTILMGWILKVLVLVFLATFL
jgi:hypothetical protein